MEVMNDKRIDGTLWRVHPARVYDQQREKDNLDKDYIFSKNFLEEYDRQLMNKFLYDGSLPEMISSYQTKAKAIIEQMKAFQKNQYDFLKNQMENVRGFDSGLKGNKGKFNKPGGDGFGGFNPAGGNMNNFNQGQNFNNMNSFTQPSSNPMQNNFFNNNNAGGQFNNNFGGGFQGNQPNTFGQGTLPNAFQGANSYPGANPGNSFGGAAPFQGANAGGNFGNQGVGDFGAGGNNFGFGGGNNFPNNTGANFMNSFNNGMGGNKEGFGFNI